jgi:hypothetical protein
MSKRLKYAMRDFLITILLFSGCLGAYGAWSGVQAPKASIPKDQGEEPFVYRSRKEVIIGGALGGVICGAIVGALPGAVIALAGLPPTLNRPPLVNHDLLT